MYSITFPATLGHEICISETSQRNLQNDNKLHNL